MIKELKYQRCKQKFNNALDSVTENDYNDSTYYHYRTSVNSTRSIFFINRSSKIFKIWISSINLLNIGCGLEDDDIIRTITEKYNTKNYKLSIL